jgi:2-amino-4-hydroxy-6-hydroxymethyldihydropteridine diphosphokinase
MVLSSLATEHIALALGSNLGDRLGALRAAVEGLASYLNIDIVSPVYETQAAYVTDQPAFYNAALTGKTKLAPLTLLRSVKELETEIGRQPTFHYGPRVIDIDIIFYGTQVIKTPELIVPHPRLQEREFVLRPLADIAPTWVHPPTGKTVEELLQSLPESTAVKIQDSL